MYISNTITMEVRVGFPNGKQFAKGLHVHPEVPNEEMELILMNAFKGIAKEIVRMREEQ